MSIIPNLKINLVTKKKTKKNERKTKKKKRQKKTFLVCQTFEEKGGLSVKLPGNLKIRFFQNFFNSISFYQSRKISTLSNWKFFEN